MTDDPEHRLIYDNEGATVAARCSCGGWSWAGAPHAGVPPLDAITAIMSAHHRHAEEAGASPDPPAGGGGADPTAGPEPPAPSSPGRRG